MTDGLSIRGLTVAFGASIVVDEVDLDAPLGAVTGLIGPNGAGKTTTFNACSGLVPLHAGTVHLAGRDLTRGSPAARARAGLGRTFQRAELCPTMTVRENVLVGVEANQAGVRPLRQLLPGARASREAAAATDASIERCGLADLVDRSAASLSTGQRRLVELARVLAGDFRVLLLDEPSSGLDDAETAALGAVVRQAVGDLGLGVLLVEHDMQLVMGLCDQLYVLEFGRCIATGPPRVVQDDPAVRAAYLGDAVAPPGRAVSISLDGITAGYGASTVFRDVSLTVPPGRTVALVGSNGAGKTTLLAVASGLVPAREGQVLLDEVDVTGRSVHDRVALGLCHVTENGAVFPALTVGDNLRMFTPAGGDAGALERALDAFPTLARRLGQVAGTMSGGEQRMLALARIYAAGATTILLDEVSLGLAPVLVEEVFTFLARLAAEGVSLLVVEQYVGKVLVLADFVYVLTRGQIAFAGEPGELDEHRLAAHYLA